MFVEPACRNRGVARAIMAELEARARAFGYHTLRLETGVLQPAAIRLYEVIGFHRISCYGPYADESDSLCFEKRIDANV